MPATGAIRAPRVAAMGGEMLAAGRPVASAEARLQLARMAYVETLALRRASLFGVLLGVSYGLVARLALMRASFGGTFAVMTLGFLLFVPFAMGYLTVRPVTAPSREF